MKCVCVCLSNSYVSRMEWKWNCQEVTTTLSSLWWISLCVFLTQCFTKQVKSLAASILFLAVTGVVCLQNEEAINTRQTGVNTVTTRSHHIMQKDSNSGKSVNVQYISIYVHSLWDILFSIVNIAGHLKWE